MENYPKLQKSMANAKKICKMQKIGAKFQNCKKVWQITHERSHLYNNIFQKIAVYISTHAFIPIYTFILYTIYTISIYCIILYILFFYYLYIGKYNKKRHSSFLYFSRRFYMYLYIGKTLLLLLFLYI